MGSLITSMHGARTQERSAGWRSFDPYIAITALVLIGFGLVAIWSADNSKVLSIHSAVMRQIFYVIVGIPVMLGLSAINYRYIRTFAWAIYLGTLGLLGLVLVAGTTVSGATRWFYFGPFSLQPSELAKIGVIISLAAFIADRGEDMKDFKNYVGAGVVLAVPLVLVYLQPDLGTSGVFCFVWLMMLLMSRTKLIYILGTLVAAIPVSLFAWEFVLHPYMRNRLLISYDPEKDYLGSGFNIIQARIAIATGGKFGHGLAGDTQSQFDLLRVRTTDFIFAHSMEMFGFIGAIALFLTFAILIWRTMHVASVARDTFGQMLAVGVSAMIFFQVFVNIGMNVGLMPVTGIPLPFVSLGGSSLWTLLAGLGLLQSVLIHQQRLGFQPD